MNPLFNSLSLALELDPQHRYRHVHTAFELVFIVHDLHTMQLRHLAVAGNATENTHRAVSFVCAQSNHHACVDLLYGEFCRRFVVEMVPMF